MPELANAADLTHVHLLLNHFPTIGAIVVIGVLLIGFVRTNEHVQKVGLEAMFLVALATLPAYVSGNAASEALANTAGISAEAIAAHNDAALAGLIVMEFTGLFAWLALWRLRRTGRLVRGLTWTVLGLAALTIAAVSVAANLGGDIRHPELHGGQYQGMIGLPASFITVAGVQDFENRHPYLWPVSETLHFIGMSLMFGVLLVVNLRLLGWLRGMSYASVHRLLPFGLIGFSVNMITGMIFFVVKPQQYTYNVSFHWKIVLLTLSGVTYLLLTVSEEVWAVPESGKASFAGRLLGGSALALSIGVMYFGRMLPYLGNSF
jgi:uncharacterized membrane protein